MGTKSYLILTRTGTKTRHNYVDRIYQQEEVVPDVGLLRGTKANKTK